MRGRGASLVALPLALALPVGCGEVVVQAIGAAPSDGGVAADAAADRSLDGPVNGDGTAPVDAPGDGPAFCQGHGAILPGTNLCTGDLANVFKFAACSCTSFDVSGVLETDALDADGGVTQVASIGANQALATNSTTAVGGSVWSGGAGLQGGPAVLLGGTGPGAVAGDVQSGGPVEIAGPYVVMNDVWANGNVTVDPSGSLQVDGTLFLSPGYQATGNVSAATVANTSVPIAVPAPCDCSIPSTADGGAIDIASIVATFADPARNDDAANHVTPSTLDNPSAPVTLPCGLYYVDGIHGGSVTLQIDGRVALFVGGDLSVDQGITVTLAPAAELDLFVAGSVGIQGPPGSVTIGDVAHAALTRIYVGGSGNDAGGGFALSADATISANIFAPNAVVQLASDFVLRGSLVAQALQLSGDFTIHYDTAVLQVSQTSGCQSGGGGCTSCNDCSGATPACIGGTCQKCQLTSDCCPPLQCDQGSGRCILPTQ